MFTLHPTLRSSFIPIVLPWSDGSYYVLLSYHTVDARELEFADE